MVDAFDRAAERAEQEVRRRRRKRFARWHRKAFGIHATVFVAVQILIFSVWVLEWRFEGMGYPWFVYPLLGWGIGLAAHYAAVRDSYKTVNRLRSSSTDAYGLVAHDVPAATERKTSA
jgi:hypothetical protein